MKKSLFGLFIAAIAITLFAFTDLQKQNSDLPKPDKKFNTFYWYNVSGTQTSGSRLNDSPVDKSSAMSSLTTCDDTATDFCLYGSTNPNLTSGTSVSNPAEEQIIRQEQ